jgi:hypothetical protein
MEYVLVEEFDPDAFVKEVDRLLDLGWELYGSPMLAAYYAKDEDTQGDRHRTIYAQALTKKKASIGGLSMGSAKRK